jgi:glycerol-3-phosphate acyltransferase PlsY
VILVIACLVAYLSGSLPFGKWIAASRGVDILREGSGNVGATNVWRVLGPKLGTAVLTMDVLKGYLPSFFLPLLIGSAAGNPSWGIVFGACAVVGHSISPFLGFKGGKSVATALGVMLAVTPLVAGIAFAMFLLTLFVSGFVSLGSMIGSVSAPILAAAFGFPTVVVIVYSALAALIVFRHKANIKRLMNGTETTFSFRRKSDKDA